MVNEDTARLNTRVDNLQDEVDRLRLEVQELNDRLSQGLYWPPQPTLHPTLKGIVDSLQAAGREHRQMGEDSMAAHILHMMECTADKEGFAEYVLDREHRLAVHDYPQAKYGYIACWKQYCFPITRDCALQLLAERRHHGC